VVDLDRTRLEGAPTYATDELRDWDDRRRNDIDSYYGPGIGIGPDVPDVSRGGLGSRDPAQV
jgi:hypothetical protein